MILVKFSRFSKEIFIAFPITGFGSAILGESGFATRTDLNEFCACPLNSIR